MIGAMNSVESKTLTSLFAIKRVMEVYKRYNPLVLSIMVANAGLALPVLAEDNTEDEQRWVLEEITITATKRETSLMDTPIAVTALDQDALVRSGIKDARDLSSVVPNLNLGVSNSDNAVEFNMRGVGSTNNTELGDPNVGFHVDGVYSPRPQGAMALMYDLERLEVLRGPQGTLFGRNSTVGSINLITAKPNPEEFEADIQGDIGNYNKRQIRAMVNIPVSESFAVRANFFKDQADSWIDNIPDTDRGDQRRAGGYSDEDSYGNSDSWAGRVSARWLPTDDLSWQLTYERFQDDSAGGVDLLDCDKLKGTVDACTDSFGTVETNVQGAIDLSIESIRSNVTYALADSLELVYNYGFADQERQQSYDDDGGVGPIDLYLGTEWSDYESSSHEIQFKSTGGGPLEWIAGLYHFEEDNGILFDVDLPFLWETGATPAPGDTTDMAANGHGALYFLQPERTSTSDAYFAQGTYSLTDELRLTLGYRHTEDEKEDKDGGNYGCFSDQIDGCYLNGELVPSLNNGLFGDNRANIDRNSNNSVKKDWRKDTYKLGIDYHLNNDVMLFASYATGFKSGIFTDVVTVLRTGETIALDAGPEEVATFELGAKATLLDSTLNMSVALFFSDYTDMQVATVKNYGPIRDPLPGESAADIENIPEQTQLVTENASEATINGLELEVDWAPFGNGRFTGYLAWLDAEIDDWETKDDKFCVQRFGAGEDCPIINLSGNKLPRSPEWSLTASYEHIFNLANGGTLVPWVSVHWEDEYYLRAFNVEDVVDADTGEVTDRYSDKEDAFFNIDASLRYNSPDENWYAELYGKNITDERVKNRFSESEGIMKGAYNPPAFYGVRVGYSF